MPLRILLVAIATLLPLAACAPQNAGLLEVRVQDHEEAIDQFQEALVTISGIAIHSASDDWQRNWQSIPFKPVTLDLTEYVGGPYAVILHDEIPAGEFDGVRLEISDAHGTLKDGTEVPLDLPEDAALFVAFSIRSDQETVILLDLLVVSKEEHGQGFGLQLSSATLVWE